MSFIDSSDSCRCFSRYCRRLLPRSWVFTLIIACVVVRHDGVNRLAEVNAFRGSISMFIMMLLIDDDDDDEEEEEEEEDNEGDDDDDGDDSDCGDDRHDY